MTDLTAIDKMGLSTVLCQPSSPPNLAKRAIFALKFCYMNFGYFSYPLPQNEPVLNYAPGSKEREIIKKTLKDLKSQTHDIPMHIGGKEVRSGKKVAIRPPHEISHQLGYFHSGDEKHVRL